MILPEEIDDIIFQPTLPARGATRFVPLPRRQRHRISTHAPRTGSDYTVHHRKSH